MPKQVLDVHQMQHLQELGLDTSNASMCWIKDTEGNQHLFVHDEYCYEASFMSPVPAYTLQDVLDALPASIGYGRKLYVLKLDLFNKIVCYRDTASDDTLVFVKFMEIPLIDAAYSMLCWAINNKFVETNKNE